MSLNTRKQRNYLYNQTFMKWTPEERISELEKAAIEVSLSVHKMGDNATAESFKKFTESISDFETMLETAELTFPTLRARIDTIKKAKLTTLKKHTVFTDEAEKHKSKADIANEKASKIKTVIESQQNQKVKSKGLLGLLGI